MGKIDIKVVKFRPANGTAGDSFTAKFCANCTRDAVMNGSKLLNEAGDDDFCKILGATMMFTVESDQYPVEWIEDAQGARCTAFSTLPSTAAKDDLTIDMFEGV